jgi:hypothetical protein
MTSHATRIHQSHAAKTMLGTHGKVFSRMWEQASIGLDWPEPKTRL